jgi:hypothetical protein
MTDTVGFSPLRTLRSGLMSAPFRFPVPLACAAGWAAVTIAKTHDVGDLAWDDVEQWQVLLISGLFLSLAAMLFAEGGGWGRLRSLGLAVAALALAALVVYLDDSSNAWESPGFYLLVPGGILSMIVAPFLRRGTDDRAVWDFNLASWLSVLFGLIVAVGLGFGAVALLGGLETLFGLDIDGDYYQDTWIFCLSLLWPWQTLAGIPGACEESVDKAPPRWAEYVVSWLLVPLALIYLLLLYGFAAKSLMAWDLPRGTVGWLVGGFAAFGLAVWSAAWPFRETGNRLVRLYHRYFHYVLVVPVLLLAIGVGVRVADYGITEKRYALILLTLWLGGIALYGILARPARLAVAPAAFAALLIAGAIGPWGATSVSIRSQLSQLEGLLAEAGILVAGKIAPEEGLAGPKEVKRISSIVRYMRHGGRRDDLEAWLEKAGAKPAGKEDNEALLALMGLDYVEEWEDESRFSYSVGETQTADVSGFDVAYNLNFDDGGSTEFGVERNGARYLVTWNGNIVSVANAATPANKVSFDLAALAETLRPMELSYDDPDSDRAMTLEASGNGLRARLHVEHMNGRRTGFGNNEIDYGNGLLLVGRME